ncbi:ribonucleotide reductase protein, small chain family [Vibrio phage vB_VspP_pVa5]|uniref:ribonucleoside-diphosphate reductase n=1 Tax=Vibrio phage vB_VspP_pVa5 TaxID=1913109 RepID=A0A1J0GV32_9CAUD|nr:ribonucleotide reductase protein, small chain family [Vibrio phage vB_VspP_pVa5]APC46037.1 ribonucleotide reductase protein, small chain family [Vibrio phage vB_VspP_pVa5]
MSCVEYSGTYKPFRYPWAMKMAEEHEQIHWTEHEIELGDDVAQWNSDKITSEEKAFVLQIMRLFTQSDTEVGQCYYEHFIPYFKNNELRNMMGSFAAREGIHQRAYALFTDTLGMPETIYSEFLEYEEMANKVDNMTTVDMSSDLKACESVIQTVLNEGVSLFGSFVMLLNFQRYGKLLGLSKITEWSLRDESAHVEGMSQLFRTYATESNVDMGVLGEVAKRKAALAVDLEDAFIDEAFKLGGIEGITANETKQYIRHMVDYRLTQLGFEKLYNAPNPFPWLDWVLADGHTNFFEQRVSDYSVGGLKGGWKY